MTSSRSITSTSKAWVAVVVLLLLTGVASAERKRVVVLDFEGEKAERFHADVVKIIKRSHTVVSLDKWNGIAEELSATKLTDKNIKKVAKRLKVDGVVSATIEKRRDEYILRIKLRSGTSGQLVGSQVNIKAETARLDGAAARDVKDELVEIIGDLPSNRGGGGGGGDDEDEAEAEDEKPKKVAKKAADDEEAEVEEEKPRKSAFGKRRASADDEEKPKKPAKKAADDEDAEIEDEKPKKVAKKAADDDAEAEAEKPKKAAKGAKPARPAPAGDDTAAALKTRLGEDDENPLPKAKAGGGGGGGSSGGDDDGDGEGDDGGEKRVAASGEDGDDEDGGEVEAEADVGPAMDAARMYAPGERAVDAVVGLSFTGRRMSFAYNQAAVTTRPAGYKQNAPVPGLLLDATVYPLAIGYKRKDLLRGLGVTVLFDQVVGLKSENPMGGAKLATTERRLGLGAVFRYPFGTAPTAPVAGAALRYISQKFTIAGEAALPDVSYSMIQPSLFFDYPIAPKLVLGAELGYAVVTGAGEIVTNAQYGSASINGIEASVGVDYLITKNIFARGGARLQSIGYSFKNNGMKSMGVSGARDTYFGFSATAGYLF